VDAILGALRDAVKIKFTVKTRIGFDSPAVFDEFLPIFAKHSLDLLTVHGRTVYEMYRTEVHYDYIARAVAAMPCPVLANGNVHSAQKAEEILKLTGARGLMIGRGAIRNPWLFHQIRQRLVVARASCPRGSQSEFETHGRDARATMFIPRGHDVLAYVRALYDAVCSPDVTELAQVQKMKKYMNYFGVGVDAEGKFLHQIRRVTTEVEFFRVCEEFLSHDRPMPLEPFPLKLKETDVMATE
jgi:tRNA-dihydrouridine synthase